MRRLTLLLLCLSLSASTAVAQTSVQRNGQRPKTESAPVSEVNGTDMFRAEPLRGVKTVSVNVWATDNLAPEQIRYDIEKKLQEQGIETVSWEESINRLVHNHISIPELDLVIEAYANDKRKGDNTFALSFTISFRQNVTLNTQPPIKRTATTWDSSDVLFINEWSDLVRVRSQAKELTNVFLYYYSLANPKK